MLYSSVSERVDHPIYTRTSPGVVDAVAIIEEFPDRSILDANKAVIGIAHDLANIYRTDELGTESCDIVREWSQAIPNGRFHSMFGMKIQMAQKDWQKFCCNMAFVSQTILRYHKDGDLCAKLNVGPTANDNIKNVLEVHEKFGPPPTKQCIEMIMETLFVSLLRPRYIDVFPKSTILTPQIIKDRIRPPLQPPPCTYIDASVQTDEASSDDTALFAESIVSPPRKTRTKINSPRSIITRSMTKS